MLSDNIPAAIRERAKNAPGGSADFYPEVTVLFADLVGFTHSAEQIHPTKLVEILNEVFSSFDNLAEKYQLEKIKTIGDAYMVAGGVPMLQMDHAQRMADMALDMLDEIGRHLGPDGTPLQLRIGINSGPLAAGVIGLKKLTFDLWGDTVNVASRMESQGLPGIIQTTAATYELLKDGYAFEKRGVIFIKGKGEMPTFLLKRRLEQSEQHVPIGSHGYEEALSGLSRARDELETLSLVDSLTGLLSRQGFISQTEHEVLLANRERRALLLMVVCLENLEGINAQQGLASGEKALKEVAVGLVRTFRKTDLIARIAEAVFVVLGQEVTFGGEDMLAARFRANWEAWLLSTPEIHGLVVSTAYARWEPTAGKSLEEVIKEMKDKSQKIA